MRTVEENSNRESTSAVSLSSQDSPHLNLEPSSSSSVDERLEPGTQSSKKEDSKAADISVKPILNQDANLPTENAINFQNEMEETVASSSSEVRDIPQAHSAETSTSPPVHSNTLSGVSTSEEDIHGVPQSDEPSQQVDVAANEAPGPSKDDKQVEIDTSTPIESVKEAVSKFGGVTDAQKRKLQAEEKRRTLEVKLGNVQAEIPKYKKQTEAAENAKSQVLNELDSTKRLIEELKLNLERAQTEENQAKQDSEFARLRVEEMEQGIADEACVAAKTQIEVAQARYASALEELKSVKDELEKLRSEFSSLIVEKELAVKRAEETVSTSKKVEKTVEEMTLELIVTKESLESARSAHLEAEDQILKAAEAKEQDSAIWEKELKQAEEALQNLNHQLLSKKDLESKLDTTSKILNSLQAEISIYAEDQPNQENENIKVDPEQTTNENQIRLEETVVSMKNELEEVRLNIEKETVVSMKNELEEVRLNIEKETTEVNYLKVASMSLNSELEREKLELAIMKKREEKKSAEVTSLEAELNQTKLQVAEVQMKEQEAREKMGNRPKTPLQQAAEEVDQAKSLLQLAQEELQKAKEEAEIAKNTVSNIETRLQAIQQEMESARASEKLALVAAKALEESEIGGSNNGLEKVTLLLEEYNALSKSAHEVEEQANKRVTVAISELDMAKESELRSLERLKQVNREIAIKKEELRIATEKDESSKEEKTLREQELKKWSDDPAQRRVASDISEWRVASAIDESPRKSLEYTNPETYRTDASPLLRSGTSSKGSTLDDGTETNSSPETKVIKKKRKKLLFPRIIMYLARRKSISPKVV